MALQRKSFMATLTLKKKPAGDSTKAGKPGDRRQPLRGGGVARPRPTLAQAQAERAERQAAFEERRSAESQESRREGGRGPARQDRPGKPGSKPGFGAKTGKPGGKFGGKSFHGEGPAPSRAHDRADRGDRAERGDRSGGGWRGGDDERRYEGRHEGRYEGRGEFREEGRGPGRTDRGPSRGESRGAGRAHPGEARDERRPYGSRHEPAQARRGDRNDSRSDGSYGSRPGPRDERRPGPRRPGEQEQPWSQRTPARRGDHGQPSGHSAERGRDSAARPDQRRQTALRSQPDQPPRAPQPAPVRSNSAEGERLSKRMSELGLASRREADEWIAAGWVKVDGHLAQLGERVGPEARIEVDPAARQQQAQRVTILLHKPIGYVSGQAEDGYEPASVLIKSDTHWKDDPAGIKYHIGHSRFLAPAGRLDIDSTGLLVLTQDGRIAKQLIGDDSSIEKEYLVRVEYVGINGVKNESGQLDEQGLALLNHGLVLDDVELKPAKVSWANEDQLRFVLREGRKRQIRRMCELVGLKVTALKRVRIGRIPLGHLPAGQWRYLAPWEKF